METHHIEEKLSALQASVDSANQQLLQIHQQSLQILQLQQETVGCIESLSGKIAKLKTEKEKKHLKPKTK